MRIVLHLVIALVLCCASWGQNYVPGSFNAVNPASSSAPTVAFGVNNTAGNLNVVCAGWDDATSTISTVTDTLLNTYTQTAAVLRGTGISQQCFYAKNTLTGGANTVTVTFSGSVAFPDIKILEFKGCDTAAPLDKVDTGSGTTAGTGGPFVVATGSQTIAQEVAVGGGYTDGSFTGPGVGYTYFKSPGTNVIEYKYVSTSASILADAFTPSQGAHWVLQLATFKAAATTASKESGPAKNGGPSIIK